MLKEKGPKITRVSGLKKLLERLENGVLILDKKKQAALPGGITEDDLTKEQLIEVLKLLIKEDAEKPETPVVENLK